MYSSSHTKGVRASRIFILLIALCAREFAENLTLAYMDMLKTCAHDKHRRAESKHARCSLQAQMVGVIDVHICAHPMPPIKFETNLLKLGPNLQCTLVTKGVSIGIYGDIIAVIKLN